LIPDDFLPRDVFEAEGGTKRKRSIVSLREIVGLTPVNNNEQQLALIHRNETSRTYRENKKIKEAWKKVAEAVYETRSNNYKSNIIDVRRIFAENKELMKPLLVRCPNFILILCYILEDKFGFRVRNIDWTLEMTDWGEEEIKRVGCSLATFIRKRKTGEHAVDAWRRNYVQLEILFNEVTGFEDFMFTIARNTLRDSIYGMVYRVAVGAILSTIDAGEC